MLQYYFSLRQFQLTTYIVLRLTYTRGLIPELGLGIFRLELSVSGPPSPATVSPLNRNVTYSQFHTNRFNGNVCSFQYFLLYEPRYEISNNVVCTTSKASDQPVHMRSLIRAFACRLNIL